MRLVYLLWLCVLLVCVPAEPCILKLNGKKYVFFYILTKSVAFGDKLLFQSFGHCTEAILHALSTYIMHFESK